MRKIEWTSQFGRDFKREMKGPHKRILESAFISVVQTLAEDRPLDEVPESAWLRMKGRRNTATTPWEVNGMGLETAISDPILY